MRVLLPEGQGALSARTLKEYRREAEAYDAAPGACIRDYVDGPLCPEGCGIPVERYSRAHPNMKGPPYHECPRPHHPDDFLRILLDEQHKELTARWGAERVREMREWVEHQTWYGDKPRPYEWAHTK